MGDIILWPFKLLLQGLNAVSHNYGIALLLFATVVNLVFTPFYAKSKKGTLRMQRLQPRMKEIEKKYAHDAAKKNQEVAKLYKEENVSMLGGCLWTLIPLIVMIIVYQLIYSPFTKLIGLSSEQFEYMRDNIFPLLGFGVSDAKSNFSQINYAQIMGSNFEAVLARINASSAELMRSAGEILSKYSARDFNFSFIGLNLTETPNWQVWTSSGSWSKIGLFLLPLISAGVSFGSSKITTRLQGAAGAQDQQNAMMKNMMYFGPVMSLWIGYTLPGLMSVYWTANGLLGIIRELILTSYYKKRVDAEFSVKDAERAEREAELEAKRLETERLRAEGEAELNPNTSKKKRELQEKLEREQKAREWEEAHTPKNTEKEKNPSQVDERQYARGRNYKPDRFPRKGEQPALDSEEE